MLLGDITSVETNKNKKTGASDLTLVHRVITGVRVANGEANGLIAKTLTWGEIKRPVRRMNELRFA